MDSRWMSEKRERRYDGRRGSMLFTCTGGEYADKKWVLFKRVGRELGQKVQCCLVGTASG